MPLILNRIAKVPLWLFLLAVMLVGVDITQAQVPSYTPVYRPADVDYRVYQSENFDLIYQVGTLEDAMRTAEILEADLPAARERVGLDAEVPFYTPVVLNDYNDLSNAFVRPVPFKTEIERTGIKSNVFSPGPTSWLHKVGPHELVHATHAEVDAPFGIGWGVRLISPDWARGINLSAPLGVVEGVAVYHESNLEEGAGRLHNPIISAQYRAAMESGSPWGIGEMLEHPRYTLPMNRFYIGGAYFHAHLEGTEEDFFRSATRFYNRFPFLGFGIALWQATGDRPGEIGRRVREAAPTVEPQDTELAGGRTLGSEAGTVNRRPTWLDDETLLVHSSGYAHRTGFYRLDVQSGTLEPFSTQSLTEDQYFTLSADSTEILFSRYVRDLHVNRKHIAEMVSVSLATGEKSIETASGRVHAPFDWQGERYAFQNDGHYNQLVRIEDGDIHQKTNYSQSRFVEAAVSPDGDEAVVLLNIAGRQGVYGLVADDDQVELEPLLVFDAAQIYDVNWDAAGEHVLLSADLHGKVDVYALNVQSGTLRLLTDARYAALEPAVSPANDRMAYAHYEHERWEIKVTDYDPQGGRPVGAEYRMGESEQAELLAELEAARPPAVDTTGVETAAYDAMNHLAPRMVYPTFYPAGELGDWDFMEPSILGWGAGLAMEGSDPLQKVTYRAESYYQADRLWGSAQISTAANVLRPSLQAFARPRTASVTVQNDENDETTTERIRLAEYGGQLNLRLPMTHDANVFVTQSVFQLGIVGRQTTALDDIGADVADAYRITLQPAVAYGYRLQQNRRDLIPNTGFLISTAGVFDTWTSAEQPSRGARAEASLYLPWLRGYNTGIRVGGGLLHQNRGIYDPSGFLPRGYELEGITAGTHVRMDLEVIQPLWFIDDGFILLPAYFEALYAYGFAQHQRSPDSVTRSSVGGGLGLQFRLFSHLNLDLRFGGLFKPERNDVAPTWR